MSMDTGLDIVIYGAGAIGSSVAAWIAPHHERLALLARGDHARTMKEKGLVFYLADEEKRTLHIDVIEDLSERPSADVVILAVKNYDLENAAADIRSKAGDPVVVGLQNGLLNQTVLSEYFTRVIYGIVYFTAWRDAPGIVGASEKGLILLGVLDGDTELQAVMSEISRIFNRGFSARIVPDIKSAAHNKLILNLTNGLLTLVGHTRREIRSVADMRELMVNTLLEGVTIVKRAGYKEVKTPNNPGWRDLRILSKLPGFITDRIFRNILDKLYINSTAQDIFQFRRDRTELESLNGSIVRLADSLGIAAPYNRTIYRLCKERFGNPDFEPLDERDVLAEVRRSL
jgi:2-dehydropantoate 2-reductase